MKRLAPDLFDRRFDDLMEIARAQLPALAPEWTDYNAHDPGITLIELLAWVTEAQLYSVGRTRRDERLAYAALLGVAPHGTRAAQGLLWRDPEDSASPAATYVGVRVIQADASVRLEGLNEPVYRPTREILWAPGRIVSLEHRAADGSSRDLTRNNDRGVPFLPFGERAGPGDRLLLEFESRGDHGLFPERQAEGAAGPAAIGSARRSWEGARWILGIRAAEGSTSSELAGFGPRVSVSLLAEGIRFPLPLEDSTAGLLRTGTLALDVSKLPFSPRKKFLLEIRAERGFSRPPRWLRIEPNVLPITQRQKIEREHHVVNHQPDFSLDLEVPGLCFNAGEDPVEVEVKTGSQFGKWTRCDRLSDQGPNDRVYELDPIRGRLRFGNGVNGYKPALEAEVYISYSVSAGREGNVARSQRWTVAGLDGTYGVNPEPIAGGAGQSGGSEIRREARLRSRLEHALVNARDIESAARGLSLLEVARAWVVAPARQAPQLGTVTLIAMRARPGGVEPTLPPETPRWLEAVRRQLAPRIPLGTRLRVARPRYVELRIRAELEVEAGRDPEAIENTTREDLARRFALVASPASGKPRAPGLLVSRTQVAAWILGVPGVERVVELALLVNGHVKDTVAVPRSGLPRLDLPGSQISTRRPSGDTP